MPITFDHVTYEYPTDGTPVPAVKDVSLEIADGSFVCVLGENGSGKSTLAKLMNGLLVPTDGDVRVDGASTNTEDEDALFAIRKKVGMVFQNPDNQMIASIIEDEIAFGPENLGVPREEIEERITYALEAVGMTQPRHHTPEKLSGGQKQRIAIASVLAMRPSTLVLDESTAMLDPKGRREVMEVIRELNRQGITIVLITHYMEETVRADRVIVMSEGAVVMDGTPAEIFGDTEAVRRYHLELPISDYLAEKLREAGLSLPHKIYDEKSLAEEICRSK
ncbi:MAG: energy-coupling factor transporter ATPase [Clostridia bacterium]|nr:energy-coupling factor transporter ATPase [Clostridia bacterium]